MRQYTVSALDRHGKRWSFREAAPDEVRVRAKVRKNGLWPVDVREVSVVAKASRLKLPTAEFVSLLHQLELQLRAGVTADVAILQIADDAPKGALRDMLEEIHRAVASGTPIHAACRVFARQFPPHIAAIIAAGEQSAQLPDALRALADHLATTEELRKTVKRALIYPAMVVCAAGGLVTFLLGGVVPKFSEIFASLHLPLPWITRALIALSGFVRGEWPEILAVGAGAGALAWLAARWQRVKWWRDAALLRVPLLGDTIRCVATARFAANFRLLHDAGIAILDSVKTGAELMNHAVLGRDLLAAREQVALGTPLYAALRRGNSFPGFFVPALKAGETTGQLSAALKHIEEYAGRRAKEHIANGLAWLEPILLTGLTVIVGAVALSFFLPLFSLLGGVTNR